MEENKLKIIGYLLWNGDTRFISLVLELNINTHVMDDCLRDLLNDGIIHKRGYASHSEEYYIPDSYYWRKKNFSKGYEIIGKEYIQEKELE